jgi:phosphatidylglycerol---prolipoprotein diacylglyceryl transferase
MYPRLLQIGRVIVPTMGVFAAMGLAAGLLLVPRAARRAGVDANAVWTLSVVSLLAGAIAAKVAVITANWEAFRAAPLLMLSLAALGSGMQRAMMAVVACAMAAWMAIRLRLPLRGVADAVVVPLLVASAVMDVGCLIAGCDYGVATRAAWGVRSESLLAMIWYGAPVGVRLVPVQGMAAVADAFAAGAAWWMMRRHARGRSSSGRSAGVGIFVFACAHFVLQFWRGDVTAVMGNVLTAVQLSCIGLLVVAAGLMWRGEESRVG